jgi:hypothetical protein
VFFRRNNLIARQEIASPHLCMCTGQAETPVSNGKKWVFNDFMKALRIANPI